MALFETWLKSDLKKPLKVEQLRGNLFSSDNGGNQIGVEVLDNGSPATLTGGVMGYVIRADGATVAVNGSLSGNRASIVLPASAYVVTGQVSIAIKVGSTTVGACTAYVYRTTTDSLIDPGHVIPSIEELLAKIADCEAATTAANSAATSANTAAGSANTAAGSANTAAGSANTAAGSANTAASTANAAAQKIDGMTVAASGLPAGSSPTAAVSEVSGHKHIAFGIPKGDSGEDGTDATPALITVDYSDLTFPVAAGTMCYHSGLLYKANQAIATSEEWTAAHWTQTTIEAEQSTLKTQITQAQGDVSDIKSILNIQERSGGVIFTGDQSDDYKIQVQVSTLAVIDSSKNHSLKANVTGNTNITIKKDYSTRFVITTFGSEPTNGVIGIRRIDNAASVMNYEMVLADGENWLLITYFNDDEDASRNVTTIKNSFVITSEETGGAYSQRIDTIEGKTGESFAALGLEGSVNLFEPNGTSANLMMTINQGTQVYTSSSKVHGMYCKIPSNTTFSVSKPQTSRFVIGTSVAEPVAGGALTQIVDVSSSKVSYTLTSGANDKYFFMAYFHNDDDAAKNIDTVKASIKVFVGTVWREGMSNFLHPLSAMPGYMTKLLSYKPLGTLTKPYICLSCDDGEATLATDTIPALKGYKTTYGQNIPVTFGLLDTSPVITDQTYKALVQEMVADYGCSVAVHGAVTLTDLDEIGLQDELKKQKDALTTAGFTPNGIIYPQHSFNDLVCAVAGGQYGVCCTGGNYTDLTYGAGNACGYRSNMYALYRLSLFNSSMTTQKIHDYVDYIEANNMLMCAFWHDSSFSANHALLDELVSYAVGKGIDFITIGDILKIV